MLAPHRQVVEQGGYDPKAVPDMHETTQTLPAYQCVLVGRKGVSVLLAAGGSPESMASALASMKLGINEPNSWSGCRALESFLYDHVVRKLGSPMDSKKSPLNQLFQAVLQTGSHKASISALREGRIDLASLDSHVLDTELQMNPGLLNDIELLPHALGGGLDVLWPAPPLVVSRSRLSPWTIALLSRSLLCLGHHEEGRALLEEAGFKAFQRVTAAAYRSFSTVLSPHP